MEIFKTPFFGLEFYFQNRHFGWKLKIDFCAIPILSLNYGVLQSEILFRLDG